MWFSIDIAKTCCITPDNSQTFFVAFIITTLHIHKLQKTKSHQSRHGEPPRPATPFRLALPGRRVCIIDIWKCCVVNTTWSSSKNSRWRWVVLVMQDYVSYKYCRTRRMCYWSCKSKRCQNASMLTVILPSSVSTIIPKGYNHDAHEVLRWVAQGYFAIMR